MSTHILDKIHQHLTYNVTLYVLHVTLYNIPPTTHTGTVVVLGECSPAGDAAIAHVIEGYRAAVGYTPLVFKGSSHGAHVFGALSVRKVDK